MIKDVIRIIVRDQGRVTVQEGHGDYEVDFCDYCLLVEPKLAEVQDSGTSDLTAGQALFHQPPAVPC